MRFLILSKNPDFFIKNAKIISAIELEKYIANASIVSIIISKFHYKKKPFLIILLKIDKDLEISFYCINFASQSNYLFMDKI